MFVVVRKYFKCLILFSVLLLGSMSVVLPPRSCLLTKVFKKTAIILLNLFKRSLRKWLQGDLLISFHLYTQFFLYFTVLCYRYLITEQEQ